MPGLSRDWGDEEDTGGTTSRVNYRLEEVACGGCCGWSRQAMMPARGSERSARQQQAFARPLPPDHVPDPVLLTVLSCPFYGVTPTWAPDVRYVVK
jgi:hypothetical protein